MNGKYVTTIPPGSLGTYKRINCTVNTDRSFFIEGTSSFLHLTHQTSRVCVCTLREPVYTSMIQSKCKLID